jgi:hypothetical protein
MTASPTGSLAIEIRRRFEPTAWQVAIAKPPQGSTFLLTWTVEPEPIDAGIPPAIRAVVAKHSAPWARAGSRETMAMVRP